jgi:glycopeptide antibiotics resistance protein
VNNKKIVIAINAILFAALFGLVSLNKEILIAVFVILTVEELKPMWGASMYYDTFDIIASAVGSILAIITYELLTLIEMRRKVKKKCQVQQKM